MCVYVVGRATINVLVYSESVRFFVPVLVWRSQRVEAIRSAHSSKSTSQQDSVYCLR